MIVQRNSQQSKESANRRPHDSQLAGRSGLRLPIRMALGV